MELSTRASGPLGIMFDLDVASKSGLTAVSTKATGRAIRQTATAD